MKKTLLMLAALFCCCFALKAQDFTYNGLNYRVTGTNPPTVTLKGPAEGFTAHDLVIPATATNGSTTYSVTSIGDRAFQNCSGFTGSLTIGNSVERIGERAFLQCSGFNGTLTIGSSVESIGNYAFDGCSGLTGSLNIGSSVESIGDYAFYECSGFTGSLTIPNSVTSIGNFAFAYCSGFNGTLTIGGSVTSIGDNAFYKCSGFTGSLTIPNSVTSIGDYAFDRCSGFNGTLTIGGSVTSIGDNAFYECSGFTGSLTIPNSVTSIGNHAFYDCSGFTGTLTIGNSVVSIGELAFGDTGLAIIIAKPATPPTLGDGAFGYYIWQVQSITVPCDCSTAYTGASGWSQFANNIEENFIEFDLTVASATPQSGSASITQPATCQNNGQVTVTATPAVGYIFANWTENGVEVSTANPYTFTLTADRNLVANFYRSYDFSAICQTGQRLCYRIIDAEQHWVKIVAPNGDNANGWNGFAKPTGDITLPETVEHNGTSYTVKAIGDCSFYSCDGLTGSLTIPNSVTSIEGSAFGRCSGFTGSLTIPNSVTSIGGYAFERCSGFTGSLTIPNSVTSIEVSAFERCSGFTGSLTIGSSVTSIRDYAFRETHFAQIIAKPTTPPAIHYYFAFSLMQELQSIFVPCGSVDAYKSNWNDFADKIKGGSFEHELTVASARPEIGTASITQYSDCTSGSSTVVATPAASCMFAGWMENGEVVSTANPYTFTLTADRNLVANFFRQYDFSADCSTGQTLYYRIIDAEQHLVSIVAPNNDDNYLCWNNFTKPTGSIELPETVEHDGTSYTVAEINSYAFYRCNGLTGSLAIPNSVTSIGNNAFYNCTGFNGSLTIGNAVTNIGNNAFNQCSGFTGSLDIPNSVTSIGYYAFSGCLGFTGSLTIPNSVTSIGQQAFDNCSGFNGSLTIGNAVTSIGATAFNGCTNFTGTLTIGSSVTSIGNYAFFNCSGFTHIIAKPATPPTLGTDVFEGVTGLLSITVPCGKDDDYKTATGWSSFASMIEEDFMYGLTVASANTEFGTASITQQPNCETQAKITATPNDSYKFANWTENGEVVSTANPYTFTLTADRNLVANFFRQYDFSAICSTGQRLYYRIIDAEHHWVSIVAPNGDDWHGWDDYTKPAGDITLPEAVEYDGTSYTVTEINSYAFYRCDGLTGSLTIPNSVISIGNDAFYNCSGFNGSLTIPNSVESIGNYAFSNCSGFTGSLTIGSSVTSIGNYAFERCSGFTGSLTIPNSVTSIGNYAFAYCYHFTGSLTIGTSVESIGNYAFACCLGFTGSLTIPNSVTIIRISAFEACPGFTGSLTIPNSVTSIEKGAFAMCSGFTGSLTIGSSVESIGEYAFSECDKFDNIISKAQTAPSLGSNNPDVAPSLDLNKIPNATNKVYIPKNTTSSYQNEWGGHGYTFIEYDSEDYHFNGTGSEWSTAANWAENEVPAPNSPIVFINANCQVNTNAEVGAVNVAAGKTLTVNQNCTLTADGIILEEGAQLVNNGTVSSSNLTVKKDIAGYGEGTGGWYLVSSPVGEIGIPLSMKANHVDIEDYDLYRFEQTGDNDGNEWINAKAVEGQDNDFYLETLSGYLYANKNNTTILFRGGFAATGTKELEYDEGEGVDFPGFNLVGNPYPCNATISGTDLRSSNYYYMMNAGGTNLEVVAEPVLAPCTGVFAVAANSDATVTFTPTTVNANVTRGEKSSLQDIRVELLANGKVIDRAYLNMNGESLPKFSLQDNASEICFYQNKEELAVASTDATRGEMPLNFKAAKNGSYSITVNVENADLNYLHLVDNLTGNDVDLMAAAASTGSASYTFEARTDDYASRFKLVFGVKDDAASTGSAGDFAYISNGNLVIDNIEGQATLQIIDVLGRVVSSEIVSGSYNKAFDVTSGLYILNLNGMTQKIVVE